VSFAEFTNTLSLDLGFSRSFEVPAPDIWGFRDPWASVFGIEFPSIDFSVLLPRGGVADPPVVSLPVFERPRGEAPPTASPLEPQFEIPVSIFEDIVSAGSAVASVFSGGGADALGGFGVFGDIFRRRTTTAEERVFSGDFFEGDIATAIGNIGQGIQVGQRLLGNLGGGSSTSFTGVSTVAGNGISDIAPCPAPGSSQGFPAGACVTIGDWQRAGSPKGFEVAGISGGDTLILRKKRRRRRRSGLTKGMMTDVDYLARKLGKPAAETYLNRVL